MLELLMVLGSPREGWWELGRLNYNRVVRVGGEPEAERVVGSATLRLLTKKQPPLRQA